MKDLKRMWELSFVTLLFLHLHQYVSGMKCFMCSYDVRRTEDWNLKECMNDTERVSLFECDDDKYCSFQQTYDKKMGVISNYDRSCSATSSSTKCTEDWSHVICVEFCQEDFCNNKRIIEPLKDYLATSATTSLTWTYRIIIILLSCLIIGDVIV